MFKNLSSAFRLCALLAAAVVPQTVIGQLVSFDIAGQLTSLSDPGSLLPASITSSTPFTGNVTYDPSLGVDATPGDSTTGSYYFATGGFTLTVTVAGNTFSLQLNDQNRINVTNDGGSGDQVQHLSINPLLNGSALPGNISGNNSLLDVNLIDNSGTALNSKSLPTTAPVLSAWPSYFAVEMEGVDASNQTLYSFTGTITSITPVPEPIAQALAASLLAIWVFTRRYLQQRRA